jgi:three-Cys-motif partner protein
MDMNRNAIWRSPERATPEGVDRMTRFWGDETWKQVAYAESPQQSLFGPEFVKQPNDVIVAGFQHRLANIAGFKYVPDPLPMKNMNGAVVYYLFFASPKPVAESIIRHIFDRYR